MKKKQVFSWLVFAISLFPLSLQAQSYGQLWKEVETFRKKDLPQSAMKTAQQIYAKAQAEQNIPQLMKAWLVRTECRDALTPDSISAGKKELEAWAARETDPAGRAVLYNLAGSMYLDGTEADEAKAVEYFRLSLKDRETLGGIPAKDFAPMTVSGKLSTMYLDDNLYDLLARRTIQELAGRRYRQEQTALLEEALAVYDGLIAYYDKKNRTAALLTKEAKLLFRRDEMGNLRKYALSTEETAAQLRRLADEYADLPACADVYVKLAETYRRERNLVKVVEVAREGLAKYPKGEATDALRSYVENASMPMLNVTMASLYPREESELKIHYANLEGFTLELYRLDVTAGDTLLDGNIKPAQLATKHGKRVSARHYSLAPTPDFRERDTVLTYTLPDAGIYVMKQIPRTRKGGIQHSLLYVSPYHCIALPVSKDRWELVAVDKQTGQPVPGAEIVSYKQEKGKFVQQKIYRTDAAGSIQVSLPRWSGLCFHVRTQGNDYMPIGSIRGYASLNEEKEQTWTLRTNLFTDRSLYRPGQIVHVSGLVYEQKGDSTRVKTSKTTTLKLYSMEREVGETKVQTDDFGVFAHDFSLPADLLPGRYYLTADGGSSLIQVEEYKRPTFDVVFDPYERDYTAGDSLTLSGVARTYAGAPVRLSRVKYTVTRTERSWFWRGNSSDKEISSGETTTDAEGRFTVNAVLTPPEQLDWNTDARRYYIYKVKAEVTDGAQETQQGELSLPVGRKAFGLQIQGLSSTVMKEKAEKVQFVVQNMSGQPVRKQVECRVYTLDKDDRKGTLVHESKVQSQQPFAPDAVYALPSGRYRMEISVTDGQGETCTAEQDFMLFSRNDTRLQAETVSWFYQDGKNFGNDEPPTVFIGTTEKDVYLLIDVYSGNRRIATERLALDNEIKRFSYPYRKEYGDGILVNYTFMRRSDLYTVQARILRPEPEKELSLKWETFRDKLQPGSREEWRMHIAGPAGNPTKANLMATLYDASLDKLHTSPWAFKLFFSRSVPWLSAGMLYGMTSLYLYSDFPYTYIKSGLDLLAGDYSRLYFNRSAFSFQGGSWAVPMGARAGRTLYAKAETGNVVEMKMALTDASAGTEMENPESGFIQIRGTSSPVLEEVIEITDDDAKISADGMDTGKGGEETGIALRENFAETAFFYPNLRTDSLGRVNISFTVPDALTEWKFMGFAHTQDVSHGLITARTQTSKPFMVQPNMPRFVRKGDKVILSASLINLSMGKVEGTARMVLEDPMSGKEIIGLAEPFSVDEGTTGTVRFSFNVPKDYDVLICRIVAEAGGFGDGEQHYLPILTNKQWMTETVPVQLEGNTATVVETKDLFNRQSRTATERRLTVELTSNPDWYAVQALPAIGNPDQEDALSWATAYYANALASAVVQANPRIKQVFDAWKSQGGNKEALLSNLERNPDLKDLLLRESPWLTEAVNESEQKQRIAQLFDLNTMNYRLQKAADELAGLQLTSGAWSWYKGMTSNRYITTQIVEMLARLQAMNVKLDPKISGMYTRALEYLYAEAAKEAEQMQKSEAQGTVNVRPSEQAVRYLYISALDKASTRKEWKQVHRYLTEKLENRSASYSIYGKSVIAIIMQAEGKHTEAADLIQSVKEYAVQAAGMGYYFDTSKAQYSWNSYKIPTQVAAMEAIHRISPDQEMLAGMKLWLLRQKQVQAWNTPIATADAVYAFLCMDGNRLETTGRMEATVGQTSLHTPEEVPGYVRHTFVKDEAEVKDIRIARSGEGVGWAAVYAQYTEDMDKVLPAKGNGVSITREYLVDGKKISGRTSLHAGDKLTVRLTLKADRDMDFIHVKDEKAACMEPTNQLSGYRWEGGLGCYTVGRDASVEYFIDRMPKGIYTLEYTVYLDKSGTYRTGAATIQSAYAPEFSGHTEGTMFTVE